MNSSRIVAVFVFVVGMAVFAPAESWAARVDFDVSTATGLQAAQVLRPSVTAYLIDDFGQSGTLNRFLADFDQRLGMILIDALNEELHNLAPPPNDTADLATRLQRVDENVAKIVAAGGTALLSFNCAMPDFLSSRQGMDHNVLTGELEPAAATVSACSPPRNEVAARDAWVAAMQAVGTYFSKYGNQVVYMFGNEPENFFVGTASEMFDTYGLAITGVLAGHPTAKIAAITPVELADSMSKAVAVYSPPPADRYDYSAEQLTEPLLKKWIDYATSNGLPIDFLTFHIWNPSAHPQADAYFEEYAETIEGWLTAAGHSGPPVVMLPTDFAGWENTCLVDSAGGLESYYDSEYLSAMFVDHAIATQRYAHSALDASGLLQGIHLVYGYLLDLSTYAPCMPVLAGLGGFPGMVTTQGLPKPAYNALWLMSKLQGSIGFPSSDDALVNAVSAYENTGTERVSILLTRHIPSELHYVAEGDGISGYSNGSLFNHSFGYDLGPLADEMPSALMLDYSRQPDQPREFVHDLLAEPPVFDVNDLGLSEARTNRFAAIRQQGLLYRQEASTNRLVDVKVSNLASKQYQLQTFSVDTSHGNVYRARQSIQDQFDAAAGNVTALAQLVAELKTTYGVASTQIETRTITTTGNTATVQIEMEPNSVWLVVLTAVASTGGTGTTVQIDFGASGSQTTYGASPNDPTRHWNNFTKAMGTTVGSGTNDLLDLDGNATTIDIETASTFSGKNASGTTVSTLYPGNATRDSLYGGWANTASLVLKQLDANAQYTFTFYSSFNWGNTNRETTYTVVGDVSDSVSLDPQGNVNSESLPTVQIAPDANGEITINVAAGANNTAKNNIYYLGAIRFEVDGDSGGGGGGGGGGEGGGEGGGGSGGSGTTVQVDFGASGSQTTYGAPPNDPTRYWNNFTKAMGTTVGSGTNDLVDLDGNATTIDIETASTFSGKNASGTTVSTLYPGNATRDSLYGGWANTASLVLKQLDANAQYTFTFYSSFNWGNTNRETTYTVVGDVSDSVSLDPQGNVNSESLPTVQIAPDANGEITINVAAGANNNAKNNIYYLGAMRIDVD